MKTNRAGGSPANSASLPDVFLPRHALLNIFHRAAARRFVFVTAPAGSGKTVSTQLWLNSAERKAAWLALEARHNTIFTFYEDLCVRLMSLQPENQVLQAAFQKRRLRSAPVEHAIEVITAMGDDNEIYALVLDDYHLVTNAEILRSLPYVLSRLPRNFTVFILSRKSLPLEMHEYLDDKRVVLIKGAELAFSETEVREFFLSRGRELTVRELADVVMLTGGWPMGVNVLSISAGEITWGRSKVLDQYFETHVWDNWKASQREFLLRTCVTEELTPELCDRLTGRDDSCGVLENMFQTGTFIVKHGQGSYRYHHLFQAFLREKLAGQNEIDAGKLYDIAAVYYFETGDIYTAMQFCILSRNYAGIAQCMEQIYSYSNEGNSVAEHAAMLQAYLVNLVNNADFEAGPYLVINLAWYYYLMGEGDKFIYYMDKMYASFNDIAAQNIRLFALLMLMTGLDFRIEPLDIIARQDLSSVNLGEVQSVTLTENQPFIHRSFQDFSKLADDLENKIQVYYAAKPLMGDTFDVYFNGIQAGLYFEKHAFEQAESFTLKAMAALQNKTVTELKMAVHLLWAAIKFARGRTKEAFAAVEQAKSIVNNENAQFLLPNLLSYQYKQKLAGGNDTAAREWLDHYFVNIPENPEFYRLYQHFTTVRACMALNDVDAALQLAAKLKKLATDYHRPLDMAEAMVLLAITYWHTRRKKEALDELEAALAIMQPYAYINVFAAEGAALLDVLKNIVLKVQNPAYQGALSPAYVMDVFEAVQKSAKTIRGGAGNIKVKPVKLSTQQTAVLSLMAKGYKQQEIADELGLSLATVKSHVYAAYKKLNVLKKKEALQKVRSLGLIK